ncbi:MAG: sulfatase-like hydrolase/transferase [Planctomycetes bacterium]|nr:sulfatase-like hydrolase/transferase [Planctomycetota bacterium]
MRQFFLALAAIVILISSTAHAADRPNVLMIVVDDLNDWVGFLGGHPQVKTPNMDKLAARGTVFTNARCQAPICNPSRASFMTGRLPSTTGVYLLGPIEFRVSPVLMDALTLPQYFTAAGYHTMGCGKVYHNSSHTDTFDEYGPRGGFGPLPKQRMNYKQGTPLWDWGAFPERDDQMADDKTADWAVAQLGKTRDKPYLLAVGFCRPHVPWFVPAKWWDQLPPEDQIQLPPYLKTDRDDISDYAKALTYAKVSPRHEWVVDNNQWHRAVRGYLASIEFVDHEIGRVLDALDKRPDAANTVIVLFSDHGFALGEKDRWDKRALWTRETRVPMIVIAPDMKAHQRCDQPAGLIDVYPTLVDLCGLKPNASLEGQSLSPQLRDPAAAHPPVVTTFMTNNHAVSDTRYHYIHYATGDEELYDHQTDPNEWRNLAGDPAMKPIIERLSKAIPTVNVPAVPDSTGLDARPEDIHLFPGAVD